MLLIIWTYLWHAVVNIIVAILCIVFTGAGNACEDDAHENEPIQRRVGIGMFIAAFPIYAVCIELLHKYMYK